MPNFHFKTGDRVKMIHEKGVGIISLLQDNNRALVVFDDVEIEVGTDQIIPFCEDEKKLYEKHLRISDVRKPEVKQSRPHPKAGIKKKEKAFTYPYIDLHIEKLVEDPSYFAKNEILPYQLRQFQIFLDKCIMNNSDKIVVIHGIGEGKLRKAIREILSQYSFLDCFDAPYELYGSGATLITIGGK